MAKNIVLCSDGTGNSGGKVRGTNVWRIYKALDLHNACQKQVGIHDDGVGTQDFVLFKMLGGAFGWGLKRNVKRLYKFLVTQYDPGDDIYFFGFSRGAHTVRIAAGMFCKVGLVDRRQCANERVLDEHIDAAYDAFVECFRRVKRRPVAHSGIPTAPTRDEATADREETFTSPELTEFRARAYVLKDIPIKFIGVWDTVDAVGVPIDELRDGLDILHRVAIHDRTLHPLVKNAYHAISIDDQRHTFHPVMWDESRKHPGQEIDQVWFAGMHSNVGGGYLKDEMALVALDWMMTKAEAHGLIFVKEIRNGYKSEADVQSKMYDSRAGLAAYYRYMPRDIEKICLEHGIKVPKIHASALDRIRRATDGYAPFNLPDDIVIVPSNGAEAAGAAGFDHSIYNTYTKERCLDPERRKLIGKIWDLVWYSRWGYFLMLVTTGGSIYTLYTLGARGAPECAGEWCVIGWIFSALSALLPTAATPALEVLRINPFWLFFYVAVFWFLLWIRKRLQLRLKEVSNAGWRYVFPEHRQQANVRFGAIEETCLALAHWLRNSRMSRQVVPYIKRNIMPPLALLATVAVLAWVFWHACSRTAIAPAAPDPCSGENACAVTTQTVFDTRRPCFMTDISLKAGKRYRFTVEPLNAWIDGTIPASPTGFGNDAGPWWMPLAVPFRRSWQDPWYMLMGATGCDGSDQFAIGAGLSAKTIEKGGRLHLFVNDAMCFLCPDGVWRFYKNNRGTARVTVTPVDEGGTD